MNDNTTSKPVYPKRNSPLLAITDLDVREQHVLGLMLRSPYSDSRDTEPDVKKIRAAGVNGTWFHSLKYGTVFDELAMVQERTGKLPSPQDMELFKHSEGNDVNAAAAYRSFLHGCKAAQELNNVNVEFLIEDMRAKKPPARDLHVGDVKIAPGVEAEEDLDDPPTVYQRPSWDEVLYAIKGSPIELLMDEERKLSSSLHPALSMLDGVVLAGMCLTNSGHVVLTCPDDLRPVYCNVYALKLFPTGSGKGLSSGFLTTVMEWFGFARLYGDSCPAMIKIASQHPDGGFGCYHQDEIRHLLGHTNVTGYQIITLLTKSFDSGRMEHGVAPRGQLNTSNIVPAAPSCVIEGQPRIFEEAAGTSVLDGGFIPRCLPVVGESCRVRKDGFGNGAKVAEAYKAAYMLTKGAKVIGGPTMTDPVVDAYLDAIEDDGPRGAWQRLAGQYHKKIALMLEPSALKSGHLTSDGLARAKLVIKWFFGDGIKVMGLCHRDRQEMQIKKVIERIHEKPGTSERDLYKKCHLRTDEFKRVIAPTIIARGDATRDPPDLGISKAKWYPQRYRTKPLHVTPSDAEPEEPI